MRLGYFRALAASGRSDHHIFPKKWCEGRGIPPRTFDSIVNKTAISYKANRMIGGRAPSQYLVQIQTDKRVQVADTDMNAILQTHMIDAALLRADSFEPFYAARKASLLGLIEKAMGKASREATEPASEDEDDEEDET